MCTSLTKRSEQDRVVGFKFCMANLIMKSGWAYIRIYIYIYKQFLGDPMPQRKVIYFLTQKYHLYTIYIYKRNSMGLAYLYTFQEFALQGAKCYLHEWNNTYIYLNIFSVFYAGIICVVFHLPIFWFHSIFCLIWGTCLDKERCF